MNAADSTNNKTYLMVLPVPAFRLNEHQFAIESAFADHLRLLRLKLGELAQTLVVALPEMSAATYEATQAALGMIDETVDGIRFSPMYPANIGRLGYLKSLPRIMRALHKEVRQAAVVHAGPSELFRPYEFASLLLGCALRRKTISVTDIDNRKSAQMNYKSGRWSKREYLDTILLHRPVNRLQQAVAARAFSLVLLKGAKMARDYGGGRPNVKNFLDSAFSAEHIISDEKLEQKCAALADPATTLEFTFFGRLVGYKGVDHMLRALAHAKTQGLQNFRFNIIGGGDEETALQELTNSLQLQNEVVFQGSVAFGSSLFERLHNYHVLLAAPLSEDTPRSALDALASGQTIVAYDTYYYEELKAAGAPVTTVAWSDAQALGAAIAALGRDRKQLAMRLREAVAFARENTQEIWLERRVEWTRALFGG